MPEGISNVLANLVSLYWRVHIRVKVKVQGPLGLDQPHGLQYAIAVSNRENEPIGVVRAELEIK